MRRSRFVTAVAIVCVLSVVALPGSPALVAAPMFSETVVAGGPSVIGLPPTQARPEMDGRYIVYEYTPGLDMVGSLDSDIMLYDLDTGATSPVSDRTGDNDTDQIMPDVSADNVVYQSRGITDWNIYLYDIPWYDEIQITNELNFAQTTPRISGSYVIWHDARTDSLKYWSLNWPQPAAPRQIPGTVGIYDRSWDIDGDTVVFAREGVGGDFTFYKWTVGSVNFPPSEFVTQTNAGQITDVRLHHDTVTFTYGPGLERAAVISLRGVRFRPFFMNARNSDVFHGSMYAYESTSEGGIGLVHNEFWGTIFGVGGAAESNPSVFGNRVAFERDVNNGDIILGRSSEPLVDRTSGTNRYETAVAVSQEYFRTGADNVVLCTGENFPDALAAAPWARYLKGPVLLTRRTAVPQVVMDEIERLGAVNVWIVGGNGAVSSAVHSQLLGAGLIVDRELQGPDRYATAATIAFRLYDALMAEGRPFSNRAFVARGDAFPDALAVSPVAAATYSPIILVRSHAPLPEASKNAFESLPIKYAYIVGGTDVIDEDVELAIEAWTTANLGSFSPAARAGGSDRYATSVRVMSWAVSHQWVDLDTVGFATGANFPDALGGGAALGSYGSPLLLTRRASLPTSVNDRLTWYRWAIGRADIFGGSDVVSDDVLDTITGLMP